MRNWIFRGVGASRYTWDYLERLPGPELGDYLGLPINNAARLKANSWEASTQTIPERQCIPHGADYGLKLALYPRNSLSHDCGLPAGQPSAVELSIGHNVISKAEVDAVMEQARRAGAVIVKEAQDTFWGGYAGYFLDPDQHLWEVAWNPQMLPND